MKALGGAVERRSLADQFEFQRRARTVGRVELQCHPPGLGSRTLLTGGLLHLAEAEPAERPSGRALQRAEHQFGRSGVIARREQHLGVVGAAVGQRVARGRRQWFQTRPVPE